MTATYPADFARDAIALAEARLGRDPEATRVLTENCDLLAVAECLADFLSEALKENRYHLPPDVYLANLRAGFAEAFRDELT